MRRRSTTAPRRAPTLPPRPLLRTRAGDDDEDIIPLLAPHPDHFTEAELDALAHPRGRLGGATQGEELAFLREEYVKAEATAQARADSLATARSGGNWNEEGEYVGSSWNVATLLSLVFAVTTALGVAVAVGGKGTVWGLDPDYASFF